MKEKIKNVLTHTKSIQLPFPSIIIVLMSAMIGFLSYELNEAHQHVYDVPLFLVWVMVFVIVALTFWQYYKKGE